MSSTYREIISQVRLNLFEPHPAHPSEPVIWNSLRQNARSLFNHALNAPTALAIESHVLDVNEGKDRYLLPVTNFGKDVLVETFDGTDPNFVRRPLRRMSLQSSSLGGSDPYTINSDYSLGSQHLANTVVISRDIAGSIWVLFLPMPHASARYRFWFEAAGPNTGALDNTFPVEAGQDLLCLRTAFSCLPGTEWAGMSKEECSVKRRELGITLKDDIKTHYDEYRHYVATDRKTGITLKRGFHDDEYMYG